MESVVANIGGDIRARTGNLRLAKPALSHLSYIPSSMLSLKGNGGPRWNRTIDLTLIRRAL